MKNRKIIAFALAIGLLFSTKSLASENALENIVDIRGKTNHYYDQVFSHQANSDSKKAKKSEKGKLVKIDESNVLDDLEGKEFIFTSGAGGWQTVLNFTKDGKFTGIYKDYDATSLVENDFEGQFVVDSKVNETCYILELVNPKVTSPTGQSFKVKSSGEDITGKYVDLAYGFEKVSPNSKDYNNEPFEFQDKFTLYTPYRKFDEMSDELKSWLGPSYGMHTDYGESNQYILVNNATIEPFVENIE